MLITNVKAHHIRIPYDAGVASFRQGAAAIAALDMVIVAVSTDAGLTGWGDAFAYVCPRSAATAVEEMIAPQAQGLEAPDADAIPAFMEKSSATCTCSAATASRCSQSRRSTSRLWDLAAKARGEPLHRSSANASARAFRPMPACCASASRNWLRANARRRGSAATLRSSCTKRPCRP